MLAKYLKITLAKKVYGRILSITFILNKKTHNFYFVVNNFFKIFFNQKNISRLLEN